MTLDYTALAGSGMGLRLRAENTGGASDPQALAVL